LPNKKVKMKNILLLIIALSMAYPSYSQSGKSKNKKIKVENPYEISVFGVDSQPGISLSAVVYQNPNDNYFELIGIHPTNSILEINPIKICQRIEEVNYEVQRFCSR
jgi:transglutaminase/protease-like cytokinesis protein 3